MLNSIIEEWKPIKDFEGIYFASNLGRIKNSRGVIMKTFTNNSGYECMKLVDMNHKRHSVLVHRVILETFNPCTDKTKTEVNHIDEDKHNNCLSNLEWVTSKENKLHSIKTGTYNTIFTQKNSLGKKHKSHVSKYHNVGYDNSRNKWTACIRDNGVNLEPKRFNTEEEAALHVNYLIDKYNLTDRPRNIIDKCQTTISQESTSQANGDGNGCLPE